MTWVQKGVTGDRALKGEGPYTVKWGVFMRGKKGGQIAARKQKSFKTLAAAKKFCATKGKNPKVYSCKIEGG